MPVDLEVAEPAAAVDSVAVALPAQAVVAEVWAAVAEPVVVDLAAEVVDVAVGAAVAVWEAQPVVEPTVESSAKRHPKPRSRSKTIFRGW
jgi:hypothetical protein